MVTNLKLGIIKALFKSEFLTNKPKIMIFDTDREASSSDVTNPTNLQARNKWIDLMYHPKYVRICNNI